MALDPDQLLIGLSYYQAELKALKRFLIKPKNTHQFQDWQRVHKPELRAFTERSHPNAYPIDDPIFGRASRYTNLLNLLKVTRVIVSEPLPNGSHLYTWVGELPSEGN